ncbi:hypothetical protein [Nonomuraea endophytica]|uniref:hypothetical protein n=1 Tax=Nonomuraea endophytica TaxID=714136 RepID=UPI0037C727F5
MIAPWLVALLIVYAVIGTAATVITYHREAPAYARVCADNLARRGGGAELALVALALAWCLLVGMFWPPLAPANLFGRRR